MICSPSGLCASLSWSMVSCGKRGSLPVAGPANIVAANQPLAAAITSDDIKMAVFIVSSGAFLDDPDNANPAALPAPAGPNDIGRSDRADIGEAGLRQIHAVGDMARLPHHPGGGRTPRLTV